MAEVPDTNPRGRRHIHAFTLIELLVVVLIIGILSAIALPQYQKAVEKASMTEAITAVEKMAQAQQIYQLANGNFTRDINELDIDYPGEDNSYCGFIPSKLTKYFLITASNCVGDQYNIAIVQRNPDGTKYALAITRTGSRECVVYSEASAHEAQLCRAWAAGN